MSLIFFVLLILGAPCHTRPSIDNLSVCNGTMGSGFRSRIPLLRHMFKKYFIGIATAFYRRQLADSLISHSRPIWNRTLFITRRDQFRLYSSISILDIDISYIDSSHHGYILLGKVARLQNFLYSWFDFMFIDKLRH